MSTRRVLLEALAIILVLAQGWPARARERSRAELHPSPRFAPPRRQTRPLHTAPPVGAARHPFRVAAIQYGSGDHARVGAGGDVDAVESLVRRAHSSGARLVVTPEYAMGNTVEPVPRLHSNPGREASGAGDSAVRRFSALSRQLGIYLVTNVLTAKPAGRRPNQREYFNTQVAFDPRGEIVAVHNKFNLFAGENQVLTPGRSVSTFETPAGRVGMLICADIYADYNGQHSDGGLLRRLVEQRSPRIVAFSSHWTVDRPAHWNPINIQRKFARDACVYLVGANTTAGPGRGGGVFDPFGRPLDMRVSHEPSIVYADIETPGGR
jgi:predicted amidohydrolase